MPSSLFAAELLKKLTDHKFAVGVEDHLRVERLLCAADESMDLPSLKFMLAPLLARNSDEQERFYAIYDEYLAESAPAPQPPPPRPARQMSAALLLSAFVLLGVVAVDRLYVSKRWPLARKPAADRFEQPSKKQNPPPIKPSTAVPSTSTEPPPQVRTRIELRYSPWMILGLVGFMVAIFLADIDRKAKRKGLEDARHKNGEPFRWPLHATGIDDLFVTPDFARAVRLLRQRRAGERQQVDVPASIRATVRSGGLAQLVRRGAATTPEYLLLIERLSDHDHFAEYALRLGDALAAAGVDLERYFYAHDPRLITAVGGGRPQPLAETHDRSPTARLLFFGGTRSFVDPRTGVPLPWLSEDMRLRDASLLAPTHSGWSLEHAGELLYLGTAGSKGQADVAESIDRGERHVDEFRPDRRSLLGAAPTIAELRAALSAEEFRWLCACAIHPDLQWDVTVAIGRTVGVLTEERLLALVSLQWFRLGQIPEPRRQALAALFLDDVQYAAVHRAIAETIAATRPPEHTFAAESADAMALVHRALAEHREGAAALASTLAALSEFPIVLIARDAHVRIVLRGGNGLAARLRSLFYRAGNRHLGWRSFAPTAAALAAVACIGAVATPLSRVKVMVPVPAAPVVKTQQPTVTPKPPEPIPISPYDSTIGPSLPQQQPACSAQLRLVDKFTWQLHLQNCPSAASVGVNDQLSFSGGNSQTVLFQVMDSARGDFFLRHIRNNDVTELASLNALLTSRDLRLLIGEERIPVTLLGRVQTAVTPCRGSLTVVAGINVWPIELNECMDAGQLGNANGPATLVLNGTPFAADLQNVRVDLPNRRLTAEILASTKVLLAEVQQPLPQAGLLKLKGRTYDIAITAKPSEPPPPVAGASGSTGEIVSPPIKGGLRGGLLLLPPEVAIRSFEARVGKKQEIRLLWTGDPKAASDLRIDCHGSKPIETVVPPAPGQSDVHIYRFQPGSAHQCKWSVRFRRGDVTSPWNDKNEFVIDHDKALDVKINRVTRELIVVSGKISKKADVYIEDTKATLTESRFSRGIPFTGQKTIHVVAFFKDYVVYEDVTVPGS